MHASSRRTFLKSATAAAAAACIAPRLSAKTLDKPLGLQLYSVREMLPKDFDGTLKKLAAIGYKECEAAGYFGKTPAQWKASMDAAGLKCVSTHHNLADLKSKLSELIDYGKAIGLEYMVCSWAGLHRDPSKKGGELNLDDWRWVADQFNEIGAKVKAAGMTFGYHNHTVEFGTENGVVFYDELLKRTDPASVVFEMDCGWVVGGGHNPVEYLKQSPERFPLFHVKDLVKEANGKYKNVIMGKGSIDYRPIFQAATGLKHCFVEQEEYTYDPIEDLKQDGEFLKKLEY
ncbi:sugar phosphate isomerase/epimerase family protein [Occallatibacter riparius]|uniref:Sugar phosphate isomerase/epimerase n=1 Tax=Occallatibacter riparius TaxID=1002689 RepID=A0A9J7BR61_9BACT|nr:sugar phosphate isomerase/epimerase [Occallatibacter riparius]UWZ85071.1 sugar phosphate isomerase/epimerase [Occallatibacter riparius]